LGIFIGFYRFMKYGPMFEEGDWDE